MNISNNRRNTCFVEPMKLNFDTNCSLKTDNTSKYKGKSVLKQFKDKYLFGYCILWGYCSLIRLYLVIS